MLTKKVEAIVAEIIKEHYAKNLPDVTLRMVNEAIARYGVAINKGQLMRRRRIMGLSVDHELISELRSKERVPRGRPTNPETVPQATKLPSEFPPGTKADKAMFLAMAGAVTDMGAARWRQ